MKKEIYDFLLKLALRFRLSLKQICELIGRPSTNDEQEKLFQEFDSLYWRNFELRRAYIYLFHHEVVKDTLSPKDKNAFLASIFLKKYLKALKTKNQEELTMLNEELKKVDLVFNKISERTTGEALKKEEILTVAKYRLKYALSREDIAHVLGINASGYRTAENSISDINIQNRVKLLNDYYMNINADKKRKR